MSPRHSRIRLPQGHLFWRESGKGSAVVFLHGSYRNSRQWLPVLERLGETYACFALDLLGCGDSETPLSSQSIPWQVAGLASFFEALHLDSVYLVGHSLGAWIAASYALQYPEQVRGLVLISPEGVAVEPQLQQWYREKFLLRMPSVLLLGMRSLLKLMKLLPGTKWHKLLQSWLSDRQQLLDCPASCRLLFERRQVEIEAELLNDRLSELSAPTVILQGQQDFPIALARSEIYGQLIPKAKVSYFANVGNALPETLADVVVEAIQQMANTESWYIVKQKSGHCEIVNNSVTDALESWGPFSSQAEAIARRVGLIRSGKCKPH